MAERHSTPLTRCDQCHATATGVDGDGDALCDRCAGRRRGWDEARSSDVGLMLRGAIAAARATGLGDREIGNVVDDELGRESCRLEENV